MYVGAYVVPAMIVWAVLDLLLRPLGDKLLLIAPIAAGYALLYGLTESLGLPFRSPGLVWQVPAHWVNGRPAAVQTLIWGVTVGPGLVTRNPLAGMWLLPLLLAFNQSLLVAILVGAAHATARALGVLHNRQRIEGACSDLAILGSQLRWRYADGLALLMAAGVLIGYALLMA